MLVDLLLNGYVNNVAPEMYPQLAQRLFKAAKFDLAPDFAAAAEELAHDLKTIAGALPHCRLPYPLTWIEVAQSYRPRFMAAGMHLPAIQVIPNRIGFLLEAKDGTLAKFGAYLFWDVKEHKGLAVGSHVAMSFDQQRFGLSPEDYAAEAEAAEKLIKENSAQMFGPGAEIVESQEWNAAPIDVRARLYNAMLPAYAPYIDAELLRAPKTLDRLINLGLVDWSGESLYVMGVLALMNTLNATETVAIDQRKLNKARAKNGKPPLVEHRILTIHPRIKRYVVGDSDAHGHRELRAHMCRGHFKCRTSKSGKTGIYFWRPHMRGNRGRGFVDKTYHVE